ncbi:hypothetical protein D3C76_36730 [compost metagenome]
MITKFFEGSKVLTLFWVVVSLGSCTYIQTIDNRMFYTLAMDVADPAAGCREFKRTVHINHIRPEFPKVDISRLSPEEINDILLAHTEKLVVYLDAEEKFLLEDISRHNQKCVAESGVVFQK